ncbi:MAG: hypothetical protein GY938_25850 [Ketobacter sp.]|nr:hypothetical protein [Ketobacter sp.]
MTLQQGTKQVVERSASYPVLTFLDVDRAATAPVAARYRIDDVTHGRIQEILDWTSISTPAAEETLTITATQNRILDGANDVETRVITAESEGADGEKTRQTYTYEVKNTPSTD